tara:strand:+ start:26 stop:343 length:318 start_codon:yes stop_codon:yes gene_type:complete
MIFNHITITSSGTDEKTLSAAVAESGKINTIERLLICNTDSTDITVNLWLDDGSNEFELLHLVTVPQGMTLDFLNGVPFQYAEKYGVLLNLGDAGFTADIIFNQQ